MPIEAVDAADYLRASGLIARGYSKFVLAPVDAAGAVQDLAQGVALLTGGAAGHVPLGAASLGAAPTASDLLRVTGLVARGYSKIVLAPADVQGGVQDVVAALIDLGVVIKS